MVIMWSTMDETTESTVKYLLNGEQFKAVGDAHLFIDGGKKQHKQYIHKVCFFFVRTLLVCENKK